MVGRCHAAGANNVLESRGIDEDVALPAGAKTVGCEVHGRAEVGFLREEL